MNNSINTSIQSTQREKLRQAIARQDVYRAFVLNANSIAPQEQRAYLLKTRNPISSIIIGAADTGKDVVELGKALVTGKSNDNQLGRFNDLGMKLGSLGIASYLFTRRGTGTKGIMEFIGAGAFFASMAAWPRLLISEPLKLLYGFDIRQQYVDAQGRKKRLYLDNQFIPDLYSQEEIDRVADKLGIDKSLPDYRELTKEKMRTIALQGNTLWMLTAGFSPLLTSMICNLAERGVTKYIVNNQYNKIQKNIGKIDKAAHDKLIDRTFNIEDTKELKKLIERLDGEPDEEFFRQASALLDPFHAMLHSSDPDDANVISELSGAAPKINKALQQNYDRLKGIYKDYGTIPTSKIMSTVSAAMGSEVVDLQGNPIKSPFETEIAEKVSKLTANKKTHMSVKSFNEIFENALKNTSDPNEISRLNKAYNECLQYKRVPAAIAEQFANGVQTVYDTQTKPISAAVSALCDFLNGLAGQKYESVHTSIHLNSLNEFMKSLKLTQNDLDLARSSTESAKEVLQKHLFEIVKDDAKYADFISDLTSRQAKYEATTLNKLITQIREKTGSMIGSLFEKIPDNSPLAFYKKEIDLDMDYLKDLVKEVCGVEYDEIVKNNGGKEFSKNELIKFLQSKDIAPEKLRREALFKRVVDLFVEDKGAGIRATGHRYILAADFERRLYTGELEAFWKQLTGDETLSDDIIEKCRRVIYDGTMNDLANKFHFSGNGDYAPKIIDLIFGHSENLSDYTVKINGNKEIRIPYGLSASTYSSCDSALLDNLRQTRENFYRIYYATVDYARLGHTKAGVTLPANQKIRYSMIGKPVSNLFLETASQKFNDRHWMRIFLPLTLAVMGVTLVSQLFFGKVKNEHLYKKGNNESGGVNGNK